LLFNTEPNVDITGGLCGESFDLDLIENIRNHMLSYLIKKG
jgi:hypothetical protein